MYSRIKRPSPYHCAGVGMGLVLFSFCFPLLRIAVVYLMLVAAEPRVDGFIVHRSPWRHVRGST